ncbi:MAG: sigma factor-like helix-turn-helix DNA-binding protein [Bacillota bacterium]
MKDNTYAVKLYNLTYRLTGNGKDAEELSLMAVDEMLSQGMSINREDFLLIFAREVARLVQDRCKQENLQCPADLDRTPHLQLTLNSLPVKERMAVVLRDICGFSCAEMAFIMGENNQEAYKHLSMGRLKLCKTLKEKRLKSILVKL